jgi:ribosomal protein S7
MNRKELATQIESGEATIVHYRTQRDFQNFLYNQALEDDTPRWKEISSRAGPKLVVIAVEVAQTEPCNRAGEIVS